MSNHVDQLSSTLATLDLENPSPTDARLVEMAGLALRYGNDVRAYLDQAASCSSLPQQCMKLQQYVTEFINCIRTRGTPGDPDLVAKLQAALAEFIRLSKQYHD